MIYIGDATHYATFVFVRSAWACPRIGEVVTPGVYFLPFITFHFLTYLLPAHAQIASFFVEASLMAHKTCSREFYTVRQKNCTILFA